MAVDARPIWQQVTVVEAADVVPGIRRVTVEYDTPQKVTPGTHIDLRLDVHAGRAKRSYSIVRVSKDGRRVTLSVLLSRTSRGGSEAMHRLAVGDTVEATQPLQNFPLGVGAARYVLLAGGIGITAIHGMAATLKARGQDYEMIYVGRSRSAMAYLDELVTEHGERLQLRVDDEENPLDIEKLLDSIADSPDHRSTELYMCGPIRLMDQVRRGWQRRELPVAGLRFETFGNSGAWAAQDFVVKVPKLGIDVTVDANETMLEALERAGVEPMFDCRKGECGLCEVEVLNVTGGHIDHRDVYFSEKQRKENHWVCACVSRAVRTGTPVLTESETDPEPVTLDGAPAEVTINLT